VNRIRRARATQQGFTLVEIAIVLVIIGLLLGAVLKGQELIFNSKVKATYNLSREVSAAIYGYQDRYKQLPGDDSQAATRFPAATPPPISGNQNGVIQGVATCVGAATVGENCQALYQMRLAGFLSGAGLNAITAPGGGFATLTQGTVTTANNFSPVLALGQATMSHKMMSAVDTSFDDGNPATGTVRCAGLPTGYDMQNPDIRITGWCSMAL
jgi:prepilin-type N-terminal cleavage/methylation domain-containing protein